MKSNMFKILPLLLGLLATSCASTGLSPVDGDPVSSADSLINEVEIQNLYNQYVEAAENNGETPISYEEWLETIRGPKGDKGDKGPQGSQGPQGSKGDQGPQGEEGSKGPQGSQGEQGDKGQRGSGVLSGEGKPSNDLGVVGDVYIDTLSWTIYYRVVTGWILQGRIGVEDGIHDYLDFVPMADGTYGVYGGRARFIHDVKIPSTWKGKAVSTLLPFAFHLRDDQHRAITLPDSIAQLGEYCFGLPDGVSESVFFPGDAEDFLRLIPNDEVASSFLLCNNVILNLDNDGGMLSTFIENYYEFSPSAPEDHSLPSHSEKEIDDYMDGLKATSEKNHLYLHYYRYANAGYNDWDVWAWPNKPNAGEGTRFDWKGRTTSADRMSASGNAIYDGFGGTFVDIDLKATYRAGWDSASRRMLDNEMTFDGSTQIGFEVVKSASRLSASGFWVSDGNTVYVSLSDYAVKLSGGGTAYHVFFVQDQVYSPSFRPIAADSEGDPFEDDDGTNVTYGNNAYDNVDWTSFASKQATPEAFKNEIGVGYMIEIESFADSDGDGFGDLYGIECKLDYLQALGVKAIRINSPLLSDSYDGTSVADYTAIDPKFASLASPAGVQAGKVSKETAMEDFKSLLASSHEKGIKLIMGIDINMTSTAHPWFAASAKLNEAMRGYYQWGNNQTQKSYINEGKCWYPYGEHVYSYYAKFGSAMPDLNYSYQATRKAIKDVLCSWASLGVDGFFVENAKHAFNTDEAKVLGSNTVISDKTQNADYSTNLSKNLHLYRELNAAIKAMNPNAIFIGDIFDGNAYHVSPYYEGFDSMSDYYSYFNMTTCASKAIGQFTQSGTIFASFMAYYTRFNVNDDSSIVDGGGIYSDVSGAYAWNLSSVVSSYSKYRGDTALPGFFTSNRNYSRIINRIASTTGDFGGISEQANLTANNYERIRKASDLVKVAEILMPGLTWIYYGDEIGMTGNFPAGKDSKSDYADLWYRQPMKWKHGAVVGDGSMTTGFSVSGPKVEWDSINASKIVLGAESQRASASSGLSKISQAIAYKNANPALITGNLVDNGSTDTVLRFKNGNFAVAIDFTANTVSVTGSSGNLSIQF